MAAGNDLTCGRCSFPNQSGDQFCARCGASIGFRPSMPPPTEVRPVGDNGSAGPAGRLPLVQRDATTRYLCAAAHRDPAYGDTAIAEFLVEPTRAIPPSPGVDSAAVLRDAVAARTRRRIRDAVLLLLLVVQAFVSLPALVIWLIVALPVSAVSGGTASVRPPNAGTLLSAVVDEGMARGRRKVVALLVAAGIVVIGIALLPQVLYSLGLGRVLAGGLGGTGGLLPAVLLGLVALAVIGVDELTVHYLVYTRFSPGQFVPDARHARSDWERTVRTLGHASFQAALARIAAADERETQNLNQADVVVHRGYSPFIGAGKPISRQLIALPLDPSEDDEEHGGGTGAQPRGISVVELQQHVAAAINDLRTPSSLGPDRRLEGLSQREQVLMAADLLVVNLTTQPQPAVLPDLYHAPATHMPIAAARHLADTPQEWARYYRCFRIEAWDRGLTTSCYLHAGTDQRMLFLEWTFCILLPLQEAYREIDQFRGDVVAPLVRSLVELVALPATVVRRLRSVFRRFTPLDQRDGEVVAAKYGAGKSLRELAADDDVQSYFQFVDVARYVKVVDAALVRAVGDYLEEHGYSVVEFQRLTQAPLVDARGAQLTGVAFGAGASVQGNTFGIGSAKEKT